MANPRVLGMIMAGGRGERLEPLTRERSKPAVPFGGKYRIVDFVLSNFINSGLYSIYLLVQYKSQSLIEHLRVGWRSAGVSTNQFITVVPPQMRWQSDVWYRGTADAVFQNLNLIHDFQPDIVAVFGADHIYRMDISQMIAFHLDKQADVTVAARPVPLHRTKGLGIIEVNRQARMTGFQEKPAKPAPMPSNAEMAFSSMGNYLFSTETLVRALEDDAKEKTEHDFGRSIIPALFEKAKVYAYDFLQNDVPGTQPYEERGYWHDVGTLEAFWQANMDLLGKQPPFDLANPRWPIFASGFIGPMTEISGGMVADSLIAEGCVLQDATVKHSIIGRGVRLEPGCVIEDSVIMDYTHVLRGAQLRRVIVDRFNTIAANAQIGGEKTDAKYGHVDSSGIVVIPRGPRRSQLPDYRLDD